jgi:hypothetical protein
MKTVNIVLKVKDVDLNELDEALRELYEVIDFKVLPNTEKLYEENTHFKTLVKKVKQAQRVRDEFINNHNEIKNPLAN